MTAWNPSQLNTLAAWLVFTKGYSLLIAEQVARTMLDAAYSPNSKKARPAQCQTGQLVA